MCLPKSITSLSITHAKAIKVRKLSRGFIRSQRDHYRACLLWSSWRSYLLFVSLGVLAWPGSFVSTATAATAGGCTRAGVWARLGRVLVPGGVRPEDEGVLGERGRLLDGAGDDCLFLGFVFGLKREDDCINLSVGGGCQGIVMRLLWCCGWQQSERTQADHNTTEFING